LRTDCSGNPTVAELLQRVKEVTLGAYAHQDLPFEVLVETLQPERDLHRTPLFQVMFVLQNAPLPPLRLPGLSLEMLEVETGTAKFDLTLFMWEEAGRLIGAFEYSKDLFDPDTISSMSGHLQNLLEGIVINPHQRIASLPLLTKAEREQMLAQGTGSPAWNTTSATYPRDRCIHQLFEEQVERTPNARAVVFGEMQLTYDELNCRANQLAHYLQAFTHRS
jgi:non-ribosomal peptide synthetase component F